MHQRPPKTAVLDMASSERPTYGEQEGSAYNGHSGAPAIIRCSCSISLAMSSGAYCVPAMCTAPIERARVLEPVGARFRGIVKRPYFRGDASFAEILSLIARLRAPPTRA
jgi:hypothetical protein